MKNLFMLMHGEPFRYELSPKGYRQVRGLAQEINQITRGKPQTLILLPSDERACFTAHELERYFFTWAQIDNRLRYIPNQCLLNQGDLSSIDKMLSEFSLLENMAIIQSSGPATKQYCEYFMKKNMGVQADIPEPRFGQGIYINVPDKTYRKIP